MKNIAVSIIVLFALVVVSRAQSGNYVLVPDDLVEVKVYDEEDLTTNARVATDGTIIMPLIETVKIGGKTIQEASEAIKARYRDGYLVGPQVGITVVQYSKRVFTVLGQVQKPGAYELPETQTVGLLQAIGMAGGYTKLANPGKVILKRKVDGRDRIYELNAKAMAKDSKVGSFEVQTNDVITVAETIF